MPQRQQNPVNLKGACLLRLMQFSEHLSGFPVGRTWLPSSFSCSRADPTSFQGSKGRDALEYWNAFVQRFFSQKGIFRHQILVRDGDDQAQEKQYEIAFPALPRYFHTHFDSGVRNMQLIMDKGTTDRALPGDCHVIENNKASLVYWFEGGSHVSLAFTLSLLRC